MNIRYVMLIVKIFCFAANSLAQTMSMKEIENDLLNRYSRIIMFYENQSGHVDYFDSLMNENDTLLIKLNEYAGKYPATLNYPFKSLTDLYFKIVSSDDGLFRIYSWDTRTGGTMRNYNNVYQYKSGDKVYSTTLEDTTNEDVGGVTFNRIYSFNTNKKQYYFAVAHFVAMSAYVGQSVQLFCVENNVLMNNVKLIKTNSGLQNSLGFANYLSNDEIDKHEIYFDNATETLYIPLVNENEIMTNKYIKYKFTGQYFEKVASNIRNHRK